MVPSEIPEPSSATSIPAPKPIMRKQFANFTVVVLHPYDHHPKYPEKGRTLS